MSICYVRSPLLFNYVFAQCRKPFAKIFFLCDFGPTYFSPITKGSEQCDQIWLFLKALVKIFLTINSQNIWWLDELFSGKTTAAIFWATFEKSWLLLILSSGHTGSEVGGLPKSKVESAASANGPFCPCWSGLQWLWWGHIRRPRGRKATRMEKSSTIIKIKWFAIFVFFRKSTIYSGKRKWAMISVTRLKVDFWKLFAMKSSPKRLVTFGLIWNRSI